MEKKTDKVLILEAILRRGGTSCYPAGESDLYAWLSALLEQCGGNINRAAYTACLSLAKETGLRLPDGTTLPNDAPYWMRLARVYRPSASKTLLRADEGKCNG